MTPLYCFGDLELRTRRWYECDWPLREFVLSVIVPFQFWNLRLADCETCLSELRWNRGGSSDAPDLVLFPGRFRYQWLKNMSLRKVSTDFLMWREENQKLVCSSQLKLGYAPQKLFTLFLLWNLSKFWMITFLWTALIWVSSWNEEWFNCLLILD